MLIETYRNKVSNESYPEIIIYSMDINILMNLVANKQWDDLVKWLLKGVEVLYKGGAAGIGSRYEDLAYCVRSTLYNFKHRKYVDEFFIEYGEEYYDRDKINFYIELLGPSSIIFI